MQPVQEARPDDIRFAAIPGVRKQYDPAIDPKVQTFLGL
jgi:hypothetical protein